MTQVVIEYTETFNNSTDLAITHFSRWNDEISVLEKIEDTTETFEDAVSSNPLIYPVSQSIFDIAGISNVREANINGYRLLYEVNVRDNETVVTTLLLLGQRQSVKEQLLKHCLMHR
jgi:hypothetical protein